MAVDYSAVKDTVATAIGDALASSSGDSMATLDVPSIGVTATWDGTAVVLIPDTSLLNVDNFIRENVSASWYKILSIIPNVSVTVEDTYAVGSFPTGGGPTALPVVTTWDGTPVVLISDTSSLSPGDSIRLDADGTWFRIGVIDPDVSVTIFTENLPVPTGTGPSSVAGSSFTTRKLPTPPDSSSVKDKAGDPIAIPVIDGVESILAQPHELPNHTVASANSIASPVEGSLIWVTNDIAGKVLAVYDGSAWKKIVPGATIST